MGSDEVLELIYSASERYDTVRAKIRYQGDGPTIKAVRKRVLNSGVSRRTFRNQSEPVQEAEPEGTFGWRCKIWRVDDHRWRQELALPDSGVDIRASTGHIRPRGTSKKSPINYEEWQHRISSTAREEDPTWIWLATDTYWTMYPFDPQGISNLVLELEETNLRVKGFASHAGREVVRLVGIPVQEWEYPPEPLWWGADEYELLVDTERRILLRCASRLGGKDFDALEVEEVFFDKPLGQEIFDSREPLPWY